MIPPRRIGIRPPSIRYSATSQRKVKSFFMTTLRTSAPGYLRVNAEALRALERSLEIEIPGTGASTLVQLIQ